MLCWRSRVWLFRRAACTAAAAGLALLIAGAAAAAGFEIAEDSPHLRFDAELALVDSAVPPPAGTRWQPVRLPDSWRSPERQTQGRNGWYRFVLQGPAPAEPAAVYLWRYSMNAAVWFNGHRLGDGGSFDEPVARNWNRPLFVELPAPVWRDGDNELLVRLKVYPGFGHLLPVAIGPSALLRPEYEQRHFAQVTLSQVAAGITLLALATAGILWSFDRRDPAPPLLAAFCMVWLVYGANTWLRDIPVAARTWWWAVHSAADFGSVLLLVLFHRIAGMRRPRIEGTALVLAALFSAFYALADLATLARLNPWTHVVMLGFTLYLLAWLVRQTWRRRSLELGVATLINAVIVAAQLHDNALNALLLPQLWRSRYYLLHLVMPLLFLGLIALLALRVARGMQAVRSANESLEARVQAAGAQLAAGYERERALLAERSAGAERERIYRDLHDNLGAKLLSLVHRAGDEQQAGLARDALAEMRRVIASAQLPGARLDDLAADWQLECELRCDHAGIALDWSVEGDAALSGRQRYQLDRMLRELVSNAIEHGRARRLRVALCATPAALTLQVADDGIGLEAAATGRGIDGVRERARDLGGSVQWRERVGGGTLAVVALPLLPATAGVSRGAR